jgi:hypothetical protein
MSHSMKRYVVLCMVVFGIGVIFASNALAFTAPAAGSPFYDFYDVIVNMMLKGAMGFAGGVILFAMSAYFFSQSEILRGILSAIGCILFLKADAIVTSFGAMI